MSTDEPVSADIDELEGYVDASERGLAPLRETQAFLAAQRSGLLGLPLAGVVETSQLGSLEQLLGFMGDNQQFVADVAAALHEHGRMIADGVFTASAAVVDAELELTEEERLDRFEQQLVAGGLNQEQAAAMRAELDKVLTGDPSLSFYDAVLEATAAYRGMSREEMERADRALRLERSSAAGIVNANFDLVAALAGAEDELTVEDLLVVIDDEGAPEGLRDAAYRLASDNLLFNDIDVARQTDLTRRPYEGFRLREVDGVISRDDLEAFPAKDFQNRVLAAWHPLLDTADEGYDLTDADSLIGAGAVTSFIGDQEIPLYVRLAVFDVYADKFELALERREELIEEWALDSGGGLATRTVVTARVVPGAPPTLGPSFAPRGSTGPGATTGGGGPNPAAALAAVFVVSAVLGWRYGRRERITADGDPGVEYVDPSTGSVTRFELSAFEGLTAGERKAWVAHIAAFGEPPVGGLSEVPRHPYLDAAGQWRWSDTNQPVHNVGVGQSDGGPVKLDVVDPPDTYRDGAGGLHYHNDGQPFDGYLLSPRQREEHDDHQLQPASSDGARYENRQPAGAWTDDERRSIPAGMEIGKLDPADPKELEDALKDFEKGVFNLGGERILLEREEMEQILSRHHPRFWRSGGRDPTKAKTRNTSFAGTMTPADIVDMVDTIIRTGERKLTRDGVGVRIRSIVDGIEYDLFVDTTTGHIDHLSPVTQLN